MAFTENDIPNVRYRLTPQMAEYDRLLARSALRWCPHIMFFHPARYISSVVNTDEFGFRCGAGAGGQPNFSPANLSSASEVNLLVGGSVVMGLGCTGDALTIPSLLTLSGVGEAPWINMGGRGFTSAQELILFLLMHDRLPAIRHVVLLSGLNNLVLADTGSEFATSFGDFFFSADFATAMARTNAQHLPRRAWWKHGRRGEAEPSPEPPGREAEDGAVTRVGLAVAQIERDIRHWKLLTAGLDCTLTYVLQPFATWLAREPHESEQLIFESLDRDSDASGAIGEIRDPKTGRQFRDAVGALCARNGVRFIDMNARLSEGLYRDRWLFVDRAHLTDAGCEAAAEIIGEVISRLKQQTSPLMQT